MCNTKELNWHNQRLIEVMKERDALLKVRQAADALVDALSSKCRSCEEACNHCGFRGEVKAYKEARDGNE